MLMTYVPSHLYHILFELLKVLLLCNVICTTLNFKICVTHIIMKITLVAFLLYMVLFGHIKKVNASHTRY